MLQSLPLDSRKATNALKGLALRTSLKAKGRGSLP